MNQFRFIWLHELADLGATTHFRLRGRYCLYSHRDTVLMLAFPPAIVRRHPSRLASEKQARRENESTGVVVFSANLGE
jgi:hypothetical protein